TAEAVERLQHDLGVRFPEEYSRFLIQFNGGHFRDRVDFSVPNDTNDAPWIFRAFYGEPADGIEDDGISQENEDLDERIPRDYFAIGYCLGGEPVLLKLVGPSSTFEGVWLWDPWASFDEERFVCHWLSDTFQGFLEMLVFDVCSDERELETRPVFHAIEQGRIGAITRYLQQGGDVEARNVDGKTLLAAAASYSWPQIVQLLLEHSADPNSRDQQGRTPLHHAATYSADSVKLLLAAGADPKVRDKTGQSVIGHCCYRCDEIMRRQGAEE